MQRNGCYAVRPLVFGMIFFGIWFSRAKGEEKFTGANGDEEFENHMAELEMKFTTKNCFWFGYWILFAIFVIFDTFVIIVMTPLNNSGAIKIELA